MPEPPAGPPAELRAARALVFVADPADPVPEPDDRHHLARVLRLRAGEPVVAADGRGTWVACRFRGADAGPRCLEPTGRPVVEPAPAPALTVAFAPAKGDRPEWAVQKLTEIGVDRVVVLATDRSVVRWEGDRAARALARLQRVAREAAAQSRRVRLPELAGPLRLAELVPAGQGEPCRPGLAGLALAEPGGPSPGPDTVAVAVGPEGGWSPAELEAVAGRVGLGPHVLRAETAAVVAGVLLVDRRAGAAR